MSRVCTVCSHIKRADIDAALVAGETFRAIADRFRIATTSLQRHKADHFFPLLAHAQNAHAVTQSGDLLSKVAHIEAEAKRISKKAEAAGDLRTAMSGIRELARLVELLARLRGEISDAPVINLIATPEWHKLRCCIADALNEYPDAKLAVIAAIHRANGADVPAAGMPALRLAAHQ